jgi:serine/threonine-protein kinase
MGDHDADRANGLHRIRDAFQRAAQSGRSLNKEDLTLLFPELTEEIDQILEIQSLLLQSGRSPGTNLAPFESDFREVQDRVSIGPISADEPKSSAEATTLPRNSQQDDDPVERIGTFGYYELVQRIGQGGMGVVYKARQYSPNRLVAIKMILAGRLASENEVKRFQNESEAAAGLDHPNIVPIYEVGEHDGCHYFTMRLIEGSNLEHAKGAYLSDPKRAARLMATVARAIHHAHQRGVLHRDLKPSNILLDDRGEPHVVDFGVAKRIHATVDLTHGGGALGTPRYMAPEQVSRDRGAVTTVTDVHGLGNILYVLLTGVPAVQGVAVNEILERVLNRAPELPSKLNRRVPRDLETICLHCLEKQPGNRYRSADELALDLESWLDGRPIKARPVNFLGRGWRWCHRHPTEAILGSAAAAGLLAVITIGAWLTIDAARHDAEVERSVVLETASAIDALSAGQLTRANEAFARATGLSSTASAKARKNVAPRLADLQTIFDLEEIRLNHLEAPEDGLWLARAAALYSAAFRAYGIDVEQGAAEQVAAQIRDRDVRGPLIAAIDDWAQNAPTPAARVRLLAIGNAAEARPGSFTSRVRDARASGDRAALSELALQARSSAQRPATTVSLAAGLREVGELDQAIDVLKRAQDAQPGDFWLNLELATSLMLRQSSEPRDALPYLTSALALSDRNSGVYIYLGNAQVRAGKLADAEISFREAIRLNEKSAVARSRLGYVLNERGKLKEGEETLAQAAAMDPRDPRILFNLGLNLQRQGNNKRAAEVYQEAINLRPDYAEAYNNYGNTLTSLRRFDQASAAFERAIALKPDYSRAYYNRGFLLDQLHKFELAKASYRLAIAHQPDWSEPYRALAFDLMYQDGQFDLALAELQKGMKLVAKDDPRKPRWDRLYAECGRLSKLDPRVTEYLKGEAQPSNAGESCDFAYLCAWPSRQRFGEVVRLYENAFKLEPARALDLRQGYRYFGAGCAARAAAGLGRDAQTSEEQAQCRRRALEWLQADLAIRRSQMEIGKREEANEARAKLRFWRSDPDLAGVRDATGMDRMTAGERAQWTALWNTVANLSQPPAAPPEGLPGGGAR